MMPISEEYDIVCIPDCNVGSGFLKREALLDGCWYILTIYTLLFHTTISVFQRIRPYRK
jgi:hypothetical protein